MKNVKNITRIITIILLVSMILCLSLIIVHLKHNCTHDDNCPICTLIHKFKDDLNGFDSNFMKQIIVFLLTIPFIVTYSNNRIRDKKKNTLVGLKVELLS